MGEWLTTGAVCNIDVILGAMIWPFTLSMSFLKDGIKFA